MHLINDEIQCDICYPMTHADAPASGKITRRGEEPTYLCPSCIQAFEMGQSMSRVEVKDLDDESEGQINLDL